MCCVTGENELIISTRKNIIAHSNPSPNGLELEDRSLFNGQKSIRLRSFFSDHSIWTMNCIIQQHAITQNSLFDIRFNFFSTSIVMGRFYLFRFGFFLNVMLLATFDIIASFKMKKSEINYVSIIGPSSVIWQFK